ncbi:MAG: SHOCT domain-containing protein [Pleomorphochaeta sp.]
MNNSQFERQKIYSISLEVLFSLKENNLITDAEFKESESLLNEKYNPIISIVSLGINLN